MRTKKDKDLIYCDEKVIYSPKCNFKNINLTSWPLGRHSVHCSTLTEVPRSLALPGTVPFNFTLSLVLLALTPIHYGAKGLS